MAVCRFNDGASFLYDIFKRLGLEPSPISKVQLLQKDTRTPQSACHVHPEQVTGYDKKADYKASEHYKHLQKAARAKRKGYDDKNQQDEKIMCSPGAFDAPDLINRFANINCTYTTVRYKAVHRNHWIRN